MSLMDHTSRRCESCDRETDRVIEYVDANSQTHYLCWECVERQEKRFNTKPGWRRSHRPRRYQRL